MEHHHRHGLSKEINWTSAAAIKESAASGVVRADANTADGVVDEGVVYG